MWRHRLDLRLQFTRDWLTALQILKEGNLFAADRDVRVEDFCQGIAFRLIEVISEFVVEILLRQATSS